VLLVIHESDIGYSCALLGQMPGIPTCVIG